MAFNFTVDKSNHLGLQESCQDIERPMPGQVQVGRGYPLLAALARHLHLLPHLHSNRLLAVAAILVAVLPENN